jgi:hypothetical protein
MEPALKLALVSCGAFFMTGLLTGVWKYVCIARSPNAQAPVYVDLCHRAALLYSFACLVLAKFVELSVWPATVELLAVIALVAFFAIAIGGYALHGWMRDTDNQLLKPHVFGRGTVPPAAMAALMWALVVAEVGGFLVLFVGAMQGLFASA